MKTNQLSGLTNVELVGVYNGLVGPEFSLKAWKGRKDVLIARIEVARRGNGKDVSGGLKTDAAPRSTEDATKDKAAKKDAKKDTRTIRLAAIELLCEVAHFEDRDKKSGPDNVVVDHFAPKARSVGVPYDEIIRRIKAEFPECQTTVACLRWYSVKIRVEEPGYEGLRLPQRRPRAKPKAA